MNLERFQSLWARCTESSEPTHAARVHDDLCRRYAEPQRHYHTANHIRYCLAQHDAAAREMDDADAVEMALWFHDAVYDPRAVDNEQRSAELFLERLEDRAPEWFVRKGFRLIGVTTHREPVRDRDEGYIVDIDRQGFGQPWEAFRRDGDNIRAEYTHLTDLEFYGRQLAFFERELARPTFFNTDYFRTRYERAAQANLRRRIRELEDAGFGA